jgi:membrane protease YdiL (CAAX protease family)
MTFTKKNIGFETLLSSLGIIGFAWFIHAQFPTVLFAVVCICIPAWIIIRQTTKTSDIIQLFGLRIHIAQWPVCVIGILLGMLISLIYRWHLNLPLFPTMITPFAFVAALIGATEELFFRGYIQGKLRNINPLISIIAASIAHMFYKIFLFLSPYSNVHHVDLLFLAVYTFGVGLAFGWMKDYSRSVIPAIVAHSLFDVWVYGEFYNAPWWVW